jgi:hypothetical protein
MAIMHTPMVESLCQTVMGRSPVLKYLLSGGRGCPWPPLIVLGIKYHRFPRILLRWFLSDAESPRAFLLGAWVCPELR